jgi:glutaredoxin
VIKRWRPGPPRPAATDPAAEVREATAAALEATGEGAASRGVPAVITLLSRPGCHLCDAAREVIVKVAADLDVRWEERDITRSEQDLRDYWDKIPVTLIDGVQHDFWHVSEQRLRAALAGSGTHSGT